MARYYYGWKRDRYDSRDWLYKTTLAPRWTVNAAPLPANMSLRNKFLEPCYDQGQLGSCTANSSTGAFTFEHGGGPFSRLQLYYDTRKIEGTIDQDAGGELRDVMKVLANTGIGLEADWPYDISKFTDAPPTKEMAEAAGNKIITYNRLLDRSDYLNCLNQGYPFVMGFDVFESFESDAVASTGIIPMPNVNTEQMVGGHAVCVVGFATNLNGSGRNYYEVRNSWGTSWGGQGGYCWMPQGYLENSQYGASDCWVIHKNPFIA